MEQNTMNIIMIVVVLGFPAFIGIILGYILSKITIARRDKKILKQMMEVLEGKRENFIKIDGVKYPAERFRVRTEDDKEIVIDLQGGEIKEDGKEEIKEDKEKDRRITNRESDSPSREDSRSTRERKRNPRARDGRGRRRRRGRFG